MGNYWKGTSDESLYAAEMALMRRAGLSEAEYKIHNKPIDEGDPEQYIHCIEVQRSDIAEEARAAMPKMVLIHGYGAGGCYFFRVIKDLAQNFHLYVVDLMGMGASGRPTYACQTANEAEDFFV
jgi:pimeloyl-ACP methyl ester carboxylesterase